ncbi:di-N-acetylchitobiase isoform X2 [Ochotona curzoniae]|uniref:di-N-acetylchitobiase isoform X2 n=1 Tax=Ochotona curzoniae TaxID=130825 RepID=UPI001B3508E2|nr:di-N-acetylchitobiase isoform X2 [Ochotona curzoniae]
MAGLQLRRPRLLLLARPPAGPRLPLLRLLLLPLLALSAAGDLCPCQQPAHCLPIRHRPDFEVFVFDIGHKTWKHYDWTQITTVAVFGKYDSELMCYAHSKGARVVLKGDVSLKEIIDPKFRAAWIAQKVDLAKTQYMDGINIDIEQEVACSSPEYDALTALVRETTDAFHREIEGSQVTFDVAWSPKSIDRRCYNYTGIADACDFLFVMSYDEQSQIWSECIAAANAPLNQTLAGYSDYTRMGINPKKLVMGVPWYGYDYTCLNLSKDHAGHFHQVWYDNPQSISLKAEYVTHYGLRGIGMWNANCLDYSGDAVAKQQTEEMWKALKPKLRQR